MRSYYRSKFNIESDNFELYFEKQLATITDAGREAIPKDLVLFKADGSIRHANVRKLDYQAKLYILWRCLKKRVWIVAENEEDGLSVEDFVKLREAIKRRDLGSKKSDDLTTQATFVTGSRDLCDMFNYLRQLSASPAYNYLNKYKNFKSTKTSTQVREMNYIIRFLRHYEGQKKKWNTEKNLSMPEWYVLIFLYDKDYALGSQMYRETYLRAYQSSPKKIKAAFRSLQSRGLILKHGLNSGARMQITPMGRDLVNYILSTYNLNC
jgi:hypothetical protein